ncbi:acetyltransferase [Acinetobacter defluvii]|uniref:GNAT family N-acetyltransferase n=1 Tax=Acinetobacter defluvii TaxID=1871111 RepID=UPI0014905344|nr:GNAT family protein [Acinetobacter defluvii]NNP73440.1 acetyltransferase [Acinetobacter defluvii]
MQNFQQYQLNAFGQKIGKTLTSTSPKHFQADILTGQAVRLIPIHRDILHSNAFSYLWRAIESEPSHACWTYLPYSAFSFQIQLEQALKNNFGFVGSHHFLIEIDHKILGWIALINQRAEHAAIEIGNVYFSHQMKRSIAATETVYLLLKACFEQGFRRVEWKCDDLNEPSRKAALRFGFQFEGIFRQDRISKGNNRNTAWFSMLDEEWQTIQKAYETWLNPENFDENGQQKTRLQTV